MHALTDYPSLVKTAVEEHADLIICGAGIPKDLPNYIKGKNNPPLLVPIVSSARVAEIIIRSWANLGYTPDAIVVEGPKAGGHLGYSRKELEDPNFVKFGLERILAEVINLVGTKIPVVAAGGIYTGQDIYNILNLEVEGHRVRVDGVQMATRFVTTHECDADIRFKQAYINAKQEDIIIIDSPVGMPGRAIRNYFLDHVKDNEGQFECDYDCLKKCNLATSPYCIARALIEAQQGNMKNGFAFCGTNAHRAKEKGIVSVRDVFESLESEYNEACKGE
jgi:nitronate monooxygenase